MPQSKINEKAKAAKERQQMNTATLSTETIERIVRMIDVRLKSSTSARWQIESQIRTVEAKSTTALRTEKLAKLKAQLKKEVDSFNHMRDDRMELMELLNA